MQKYLSYILIIIILTGFFSPIIKIYATDPTPTLGTCRQGTAGTPTQKVEEKNCTGEKAIWIPYYYHLAPLTDPDTGKPQEPFDPTQTNNLSAYLNLMIKLFIGICAVLAVIMIVMGGIEYMTSDLPGMKSAGKDRIIHALLGLLLALAAWTLLNTINPNILKTDLESLANITVDVELNADIPQATPPPGGKYADGSKPGDSWQSGVSSTPLPAGVTLNSKECTRVGEKNCTSTKGLNTAIINKVSSKCINCGLVITGGTESWEHSANSSHKPGSPTIDLRVNNNLNNYITGGKKPVSMQRYSKDGISYLYEGDHWHVYM